MAYDVPFHRLVLVGTLYDDMFNTTLSIFPRASTGTIGLPLPEDIITLVATPVANFWGQFSTGSGAGIHGNAILKSIKLNRIGVDGKYADPESHEYVYPSPVPGGDAFNAPAQLATVATLRTAFDRGRASKGRMYLPVCKGYEAPGADGRATAVQALRVANATAQLVNAINTVYAGAESGDESLGRVAIGSSIGAGRHLEVTGVTVGRATDTMRSRRNKISESPVAATSPITGTFSAPI